MQSADLDSALSMGFQLWGTGGKELKRKTKSEELHLRPSHFEVASGVLYPLACQVAWWGGKNPWLRAGRPESSRSPPKHQLCDLEQITGPLWACFPVCKLNGLGQEV